MAGKSILLLGSGFVAGPCLDVLLRRPENKVTVACRHKDAADKLCGGRDRATGIALDVKNADALKAAVAQHDLVISLIPYTFHPLVIEAAIATKKHFVSTSYVSATMAGYDEAAKAAGISVMNEIGVDPGIDHLYAMKTITETHARGGQITSFTSYCGGLPAPECSNNPLGYKLSWSGRGVLLAAGNDAKFLENGKVVEIPGPRLLYDGPKEISIYPGFAFEGYPNRDSTPYTERYGIPECQTVLRGTLRYKGNPAFVRTLGRIGLLNDNAQPFLAAGQPVLAWRTVLAKLLGCDDSVDAVVAAVVAKAELDTSNPDDKRIISGLKWLGLLSDDPVAQDVSVLDALANVLAEKLKYGPNERDMIMMQHKFHITNADGSTEVRTSTMVEYGNDQGTAMARTVGIPCGLAAQLILDGKITKRGVFAPLTPDLYEPIIELLEQEGLGCKEEIVVE